MSVVFAHGASDIAFSIYNWYLDPTLVFVLLAAVFYKRGLKYYRNRPAFSDLKWKQWFFWAGILIMILVLGSPLDFYSDNSFTLHMIQHLSLMMIAAPLILLGAPYILIVRGFPRKLGKTFSAIVRFSPVRSFFRFLAHPIISLIVYTFMVWLWHYPPLYNLALRNEYWHLLEHFAFFYSSIFFWWNIIDPYPVKAKYGYILRIGLIFAAAIQNSGISSFIVFQSELIYNFSDRINPFGFSQHTDQILGGLTMWVPGSMMYILAMGVCFAVMVSKEKRPPPEN